MLFRWIRHSCWTLLNVQLAGLFLVASKLSDWGIFHLVITMFLWSRSHQILFRTRRQVFFLHKCMLLLSVWLLLFSWVMHAKFLNRTKLTSLTDRECSRGQAANRLICGCGDFVIVRLSPIPFPIYKHDRVASWNDLRVWKTLPIACPAYHSIPFRRADLVCLCRWGMHSIQDMQQWNQILK